MVTIVEVLTFAERVRKASIAFYGQIAPLVALVATQDFSTPVGVGAFAIALLNTVGIYASSNVE